jgi:superfamily II DNA or RNA helicase
MGILQGKSAIVQLPTGVGKTKSIELIIRSAYLSDRARVSIIIAPLRALCNEIASDMQLAFEGFEINQFSDINVEYETITKGRKTVSLRFHINSTDVGERVEAYSNCVEALDGGKEK